MPQHRFDTPDPVRLDVRLAAGELEVETVDGPHSTIALEGPIKLVEPIQVELNGDRLTVHERRRGVSVFLGSGSVRVLARVPRHSTVEVATASCDTTLSGRYRGVRVKSASGELRARGELDGEVEFDSASGDVRLPSVTGELRARTVSGDVTVQSLTGSATVRSVSGDLRVDSVREGRAKLDSVSGDIELGIAAGTGVDLDASSLSGHVSSEVPLADAPDGQYGCTVVIRGRTVSGDVTVSRAGAAAPTP